MSNFTAYLQQILNFLQIKMNVFGFIFSFWDIMLFVIVSTLIFRFIGEVMYD